MIPRDYVESSLMFSGLFLIFISSPVGSISEFKYMSTYLFRFGGMFIIIAAFRSIMRKKRFFNHTFKIFIYLYAGFIGLIVFSIIVNQSLDSGVFTLERFVSVFFILGVSLALIDNVSEKIIINALIVSLGTVIVYFLIEYPLSDSEGAYSGGFFNPNTLGVIVATFTVISFVASASSFKSRQNYFLATIYLLFVIGGSYLVILSNSRTAFVALAITLSIIAITFIYEVLKSYNLMNWKSLLIIFLLAFGGTILFVSIDNPLYEFLDSNIIDKFKRKIAGNGLTDGRVTIWGDIIRNASLFGEVEFYRSAHNGFLQVIIIYGWLAGIAYVIFWLAMFIKSIQYFITRKSTNPYAILRKYIFSYFNDRYFN